MKTQDWTLISLLLIAGKQKCKDKAEPSQAGEESTEGLGEYLGEDADAIPPGQGSQARSEISQSQPVNQENLLARQLCDVSQSGPATSDGGVGAAGTENFNAQPPPLSPAPSLVKVSLVESTNKPGTQAQAQSQTDVELMHQFSLFCAFMCTGGADTVAKLNSAQNIMGSLTSVHGLMDHAQDSARQAPAEQNTGLGSIPCAAQPATDVSYKSPLAQVDRGTRDSLVEYLAQLNDQQTDAHTHSHEGKVEASSKTKQERKGLFY